ncbi:AAA family ATPase [Chryseobacterium sp. CFS15]|uniref:AAA family ATPase n=1 Tax=Chryseobacterium sp. CFS15 TaxID=2986946 RepID=UPI00280761EA|nr:AAA family ATPase [Chryseobacterium sp. CFS15]MDQ8141113.1 AAA family ATPase [Chryseobacterium sp. CFS15]
MSIKSIRIENLFDSFNHEINFSQESNITMILGRNGLGKTVILKIIKAILNRDIFQLENIEFSKIIIEINNEESWCFIKDLKEDNENIEQNLSLIQLKNGLEVDRISFSSIEENLKQSRRTLARYIPPAFRPIDGDDWIDRRSDLRFSTTDIIEKFRNVIPENVFNDYLIFPQWYSDFTTHLNVSLIETQRLLSFAPESEEYNYRERGQIAYKNTVEKYSEDLVKQIHAQLAKSSELSTKLDRTYPNRLIKKLKETTNVSQEDLNQSLSNLEKKRERLQEVGLLDLQNQPHIDIIDEDQDDKIIDVLQVYIEDSRQKLDVYDELADRIELFLRIINERFLKKKLTISRTEGFHFESTKNDKPIPLKSLSSGEQHILVLYYELLFKIKKGTLLLMDEPEISLHIAWQKRIIGDLEQILKLNPMQIIIATHSPAVIGSNWHLTTELDAED